METESPKAIAKPAARARRILSALERLTLLRAFSATEAAQCLRGFFASLAKGDRYAAVSQYHALTAALLQEQKRRVTGDIWKDYVVAQLLEAPNRFSQCAAEGKSDPPLDAAMRQDLRAMQELFSIADEDLLHLLVQSAPSAEPKAPSAAPEENISRMALSAWGGNNAPMEAKRTHVVAAKSAPPQEVEIDPALFLRWAYDRQGDAIEYAADEGLAPLYRRFFREEDWGALVDELRAFHTRYGCGEFLRYSRFCAGEDGFFGVEDEEAPEWDALTGLTRQKERIYANTLRFAHTGQGENILLYGAEGMGKRSLVLAMTRELPDLRLVYFARRDYASAAPLVAMLSKQPYNFLVLIDDLSFTRQDLATLRTAFDPLFRRGNVLLYAIAAQRAKDGSLFTTQIPFDALDYKAFCQMTRELIRREHSYVEDRAIETACGQWRDEEGNLSGRAAQQIAQRLLRENRR